MQAVILAGGKGTRLRPYTTVLPKPLMPLGDRPILEIILRQLHRAGVRRVILLDLAFVGTGRGPTTERMCRDIISKHPELEIYIGGGVGGRGDLVKLQACGATGVLAASALHDGRILELPSFRISN